MLKVSKEDPARLAAHPSLLELSLISGVLLNPGNRPEQEGDLVHVLVSRELLPAQAIFYGHAQTQALWNLVTGTGTRLSRCYTRARPS